MQLKQALAQAVDFLTRNEVPSPRLNAETLLMFTLACDRAYLYAHPERELAPEEQQRYDAATAERARGVPSQYITGHQEFWGLDLVVTPAVLIPRPETEHVIEVVLELIKRAGETFTTEPRIVDVGTGSGCIALALASELPRAAITALDISPEALEIARINAARLGFYQRIEFFESDLLAAVPHHAQFDCVVSNPPYVATAEAAQLQKQVREHEPHLALFAGERGLAIYERLAPQARRALAPGGWFVGEIGFGIESDVRALLEREGFSEIQFTNDLQGIPRVVAALRTAQ